MITPPHPIYGYVCNLTVFSNMSASQIPNLNSLRSSRGGTRGRGRGRGAVEDEGSRESESAAAKDRIVQQTDSDASVSRLSAVKLGYLEDPYSELFVPENKERRFPIINRGPLDLILFIVVGQPRS